jgi:hypothetical protein
MTNQVEHIAKVAIRNSWHAQFLCKIIEKHIPLITTFENTFVISVRINLCLLM